MEEVVVMHKSAAKAAPWHNLAGSRKCTRKTPLANDEME